MFDEETYAAAIAYFKAHSGESGTQNYNDLENRPRINNTTLAGNKSASDLGLAETPTIQGTMLIF